MTADPHVWCDGGADWFGRITRRCVQCGRIERVWLGRAWPPPRVLRAGTPAVHDASPISRRFGPALPIFECELRERRNR